MCITIVGSSSLTAGNIKNGVTIFGVKGTFRGWVDSTVTLFNNGSAVSGFGYKWIAVTVSNTPSSGNGWTRCNGILVLLKIPGISSGPTPKSGLLTVALANDPSRTQVYCVAYSKQMDDAVTGKRTEQPFTFSTYSNYAAWWLDPALIFTPSGSLTTSDSPRASSWSGDRTWNGWIGLYSSPAMDLKSVVYNTK